MQRWFSEYLWTGLSVWIALYICDYTLTIICARLYQKGAREKIRFEGSYEITPYFQRDIDALRKLSLRFIVALAAIALLLSSMWFLGHAIQMPEFYFFVLGMMVLVQLAVQKRHLQNLFLFRAILAGDAIQGSIAYPRPMMLRLSAIDFLSFAGLYAILFAFTGSWFVLGGSIGCLSVAAKHIKLAKSYAKTAAATACA